MSFPTNSHELAARHAKLFGAPVDASRARDVLKIAHATLLSMLPNGEVAREDGAKFGAALTALDQAFKHAESAYCDAVSRVVQE